MARFKKGTNKVRCDLTGSLINVTEGRMRWDGLFVRKEYWSIRQPQDRAPKLQKEKPPTITRPEGTDEFITATDVTAEDL